jgi:hypothetical protein
LESLKTQGFAVTKTKQLMLRSEAAGMFCGYLTDHTYTVWAECRAGGTHSGQTVAEMSGRL